MKLVQINMFSLPEVVADFTQAQPAPDAKPFSMEEWGKAIGGEWEKVQAEKQKAGAQ